MDTFDILVVLGFVSVLLLVFSRWEKKKIDKRLKSGTPRERVLYSLGIYSSLCAGQIARETSLSCEEIIVLLKKLEEEGKIKPVPEEKDYPAMLMGWRLNISRFK